MPSPFSWDVTKPAGTDPLSISDDLLRQDKDTLRKVLGTLLPFGTTTIGWRAIQVGDVIYLAQNASYDGTNFNRDDTTKAARALRYNADGSIDFLFAAAGANPISWSGQVSLTASGDLITPRVVVGTDPGGTETLRAGSARLNAPVLLGSVPQFTLAADPTSALQAATKQYVDNKPAVGDDVRWLLQGNALVANKVAQALMGSSLTFTRFLAYADTAPSGAAIGLRLNKNGTQVATLSIASGSNSASATISVSVASGDRLSLDITGVGSSVPGGNDLLVTVSP